MNIHKTPFTVYPAVVEAISTISGHFEKLSTAIKNILSWNGPAKLYIVTQGLDGQIHGWNTVDSGDFCTC